MVSGGTLSTTPATGANTSVPYLTDIACGISHHGMFQTRQGSKQEAPGAPSFPRGSSPKLHDVSTFTGSSGVSVWLRHISRDRPNPQLAPPQPKWTEELHKQLEHAVAALGGAGATSGKAILDRMKSTSPSSKYVTT